MATYDENNELIILRHIIDTYGHLDFDELYNNPEMMDCVLYEHGINEFDGPLLIREKISESSFFLQHYMFRSFFDKNNEWYDWYRDEYGISPKGVKKTFNINKILNKYKK